MHHARHCSRPPMSGSLSTRRAPSRNGFFARRGTERAQSALARRRLPGARLRVSKRRAVRDASQQRAADQVEHDGLSFLTGSDVSSSCYEEAPSMKVLCLAALVSLIAAGAHASETTCKAQAGEK